MKTATQILSRRLLVLSVGAGMLLALSLSFVMAPQARAAALTEQQVQAVLGLLSAFGADAATTAKVEASLRGTAAVSATPSTAPGLSQALCVLTRNLMRGLSGEDVRCLQNFLITQGHLASGNATGYFGPLTEAAVQRLQAQKGIVQGGTPAETGYGAVGPKTRATITGPSSTDGLDADFSALDQSLGALESEAAGMRQSVEESGSEE